MGLINLLESKEHRNNVGHFSAIVNIAKANGEVNEQEIKTIKSFARKLEIRPEEYEDILENSKNYITEPIHNAEKRMEHIYDLLKVINSDGEIDDTEKKIVLKYAILLGVPTDKVDELIKKSIRIFNGNIDFEEYQKFLKVI